VEVIASTFHDEHERLYTYCVRDMPVDLNAWRVTATGRLPELPAVRQRGPSAARELALKNVRPAFFEEVGRRVDTPIYDGEELTAGAVIEGPAIAELQTTTLVVPPHHKLRVDDAGNFTIDVPNDVQAGASAVVVREPIEVP
jgi:N-methylhydantoinase A